MTQAAQKTEQPAAEGEILPPLAGEVQVYNPFRSQLAELKKSNSTLVFDYDSKAGNEAARSYIYKLRQTKSAVDKARKAEKEESLNYGRKVDAEAKAIIGELDSMIEVHQTRVDEIEEREKKRLADIKARIDNITRYQQCAGHDSKETAAALEELKKIVIDEASFGEFLDDARQQLEIAIAAQERQNAAATKAEDEAAELEALRKEKEERDRKDREAAIAAEAAAKAKKEAEDKAAAEAKAAQEKADREKKEAEEAKARAEQEAAAAKAKAEKAEADRIAAEKKAEEDRIAAEKKAEEDRKAAVEKAAQDERDRIAREQKEADDARIAREADQAHKDAINAKAITELQKLIGTGAAQQAIEEIAAGRIPNVTINY